MNPHFFTAPFYFAFIWFRVQGSGGGFAAFFRRWYSRIAAFPSRECYSVKEIVSYVTSCFPLRGKCRRQ